MPGGCGGVDVRAGRKGFFPGYELRMDTLVTHPLFDYRVSYRRMLEIQARLLARVMEGEIAGVSGVCDAVRARAAGCCEKAAGCSRAIRY